MLIRNVNQITSTSIQVQLFILGFHDTDLFVLIPAILPNWSYYSNCMELDARLALVWHCSLAAFPRKAARSFANVFLQKVTCKIFPFKCRSTTVLYFHLAVLLDWSGREVEFQYMGLSWPCGYCAVELMVIGGKNESCYRCLAVELCSHFVFSLALQNLVWMWSLVIDSMLLAALAQCSAPIWDCSIEGQRRTAPKCVTFDASIVFISRKQRGLPAACQLLILFPSH